MTVVLEHPLLRVDVIKYYFSQPAKIWFILEVPGSSAILDMCWCPLLSADFFSKQQLHNGTIMESQKGKLQTKRLAKVTPEEDTEVLGLLAIATNNGNVLIYRYDF
jgi:hypothetical protein